MRSWTYSYKTSDGLRHEGEMSAPNKDAVYVALRERGIRAIRVDERIVPVVRNGFRGLRKRDWVSVVAVGLVFAVAIAIFVSSSIPVIRASYTSSLTDDSEMNFEPNYRRLVAEVESVMTAFRDSVTNVDYELLSNYRLIARTTDMGEFRAEIEKAHRAVDAGRRAVRDVYDRLYAEIPEPAAVERNAAQRLYGEAMDEIDSVAEAADGDDFALELLDRNRGMWHVERSEVKWTDARLEKEFSLFLRARRRKAKISY